MLRAYSGEEPYVFVSYSHKDSETVKKCIEGLQRNGCNVWFDEGIESGGFWDNDIAAHLENAKCVLWFVSEGSISSNYVLGELNFAMSRNMQVFPVYIEDIKLPIGLELVLGRVQAVNAVGQSACGIRRKIAGILPPDVFHKSGTPFFIGAKKSLYIRDTTTVFSEGTFFEGDDDCSFELYWAEEDGEGEEHLLWKYRARPVYDMLFRITDCIKMTDPYFDENGNGAIVFNMLLNFISKPLQLPDADALLTLAVASPEEEPRLILLDKKIIVDDARAEAYINNMLDEMCKTL